MTRVQATFFLLSMLLTSLVAARGSAQGYDQELPPDRSYISPERFTLELRIGTYQPDMGGNNAFKTFFGGDQGPLVAFELDVIGYRIPDIVYFNGAGAIGTANWSGHSVDASFVATSEKTSLSYLPLDLLAVARFDMLARKFSIPFILTGKLGYEWGYWSATTGRLPSATGWSVGFRWGAQIALDLDTFDKKAARNMDEEWGINHSFVFFEVFGFEPSKHSLPMGNTAWSAGLGFVL